MALSLLFNIITTQQQLLLRGIEKVSQKLNNGTTVVDFKRIYIWRED